ncbi:MAG: PAS domain S-box protein, partial [Desulfuromonadaceae bacterium]
MVDANTRLDTIFDSVQAGILLIDAQSLRIVEGNRQAGFILDTSLEELIGRECIGSLCSGYQRKQACPVLVDGLSHLSNECSVQIPNGRMIPVLKTVVPVVLDGRQYLLESFLDITERKKAEESVQLALAAAEDSRAKMDGILQSVADPLIVTDPVFRIVMMNRAAEELLGVCLFDSLGLPLGSVIADQRLLEELQTIMTRERSDGWVDFTLPVPDGSGEWVYQGRTSSLCAQDGRITGLITIMRNVTFEREVDRMKSEFVSTAAHELQTPLASILGFAELLLSQKGEISPEMEQEGLTYIFEKAD